MHAASSDNIQPLALLACEKFGATLAMCRTTCGKIETDVLPASPPAPIAFLQFTVGYSRHDSINQLGKSAAGVRFLGLAAALVTTMGPFQSASAISLMLENAAADTTLLPSNRQVRDLLAVLEARLIRSRFIDSVLEWHRFLCKQSSIGVEYRANHRSSMVYNPTTEGIESLVDAFRRLHRVGDSNVSKITIHTNYSSPWVVAFTQWCLGAPPSIYANDRTPILEQANLSVDLIVGFKREAMNKEHISVTVHHGIESPEELVSVHNGFGIRWNGMTTIEKRAQWILEVNNMDRGSAFHALRQCLPYAAKKYLKECIFTSSALFDYRRSLGITTQDTTAASEFRTSPFRGDRAVAEVLHRMLNVQGGVLGARVAIELPELEDGMMLTDLPLVKSHFESLRAYCQCRECDPEGLSVLQGNCEVKRFITFAKSFLCDAITLSLFHNSDDLLILVDMPKNDLNFENYRRSLSFIFDQSAQKGKSSRIEHLLGTALALVGHTKPSNLSHWAMSCFNGQVVYPAIFQSPQIKQDGFLALSWHSGMLHYKGETYHYVHGETSYPNVKGFQQVNRRKEVVQPLNLYFDTKLSWIITVGDSTLTLGAYLEGSGTKLPCNPTHALTVLTDSFVIERCCHDRDSKLDRADPLWNHSSPEWPGSAVHGVKKSVVTVDGSDELRFYSAARVRIEDLPVVVRINACLACSLKLCKDVGSSILIL